MIIIRSTSPMTMVFFGRVEGWFKKWVGGGMGRLWDGWVQGIGGWLGFMNINDIYNNDVGKGGAQGCEAYEVK